MSSINSVKDKLNIIILAAGKGKRINAKNLPKAMYPINNIPMVGYFIDKINKIKPDKTIIVVGFQGQKVVDYINSQSWEIVWQREQLGTGHAVAQAKKNLVKEKGITIVVNVDNPFFNIQTFKNIASKLRQQKAVIAISSVELDENFSYGRLDEDSSGHIKRIIEVKNATPNELKIKKMNAGLYAFDNKWLWKNLEKLKIDKISGEYYLTDLVAVADKNHDKVIACPIIHIDEAIGINTLDNLRAAEKALEKKV